MLFDRDQRSHWNNHYNCCFVLLAALGIYCTDFLPQMTLQVSRCVLEPPMLLADLFVLSPGYKVPPDLATMPLPFSMRGLCLWCPQHQFKCLKWRCRHRDVKRIIFSYCNDIMNPYKRSRPDRDTVLWLPTANWTVSRVCPTMCSTRTVPEVLTVFLVK